MGTSSAGAPFTFEAFLVAEGVSVGDAEQGSVGEFTLRLEV